jgi:hypothetical protein
MLHFNNLDYCAVPALPADFKAPLWLKVELGILAGRLYFEFEEYQAIKDFLGITDCEDIEKAVEVKTASDGLTPEDWVEASTPPPTKTNQKPLFTSRPVSFMNEYLAIVRKDSDVTATPMGYLLSQKPLTSNHSFFAERKVEDVRKKIATMRQEAVEEKKEEYLDEGDDFEVLETGPAGEEPIAVAGAEDGGGEDWYAQIAKAHGAHGGDGNQSSEHW